MRQAQSETTSRDVSEPRWAIDKELSRPEDDVQWRETWRQAVEETAGIAPYLPDGVTYVDEVRAEERRRRAQER